MCHLVVLMPPAFTSKRRRQIITLRNSVSNRNGEIDKDHVQTHTHRRCCLKVRKKDAILSLATPLDTQRNHPAYPLSVTVTLMELIWKTSAALPGRGIYWQGESQTQSITLPVCPGIFQRERWLAKINGLFDKKQSI